ncbi:tRNA lysidine(34) synthetase TilS [bacterium]|nr:tRNA lysidine(34) synthetase TilS [bacterium]
MPKPTDLKKSFLQKVIRELKSIPILPKRILVASSGGADSMALVWALFELRSLFSFDLVLAHVHHGAEASSPPSQETADYRKQAQDLVLQTAEALDLPCFTNPIEKQKLISEAELRAFRYKWLTRWQEEAGCEAIALAHHFEDLLETQVMRMLRGSGQLGLGAMVPLSPQKRLRPFLNLKKEELKVFLESSQRSWVEDPSNQEMGPTRNRLRKWLSQVEDLHSGGLVNLSKSLQRLSTLALELERPWKSEAMTEGAIRRSVFLALSQPLKAELLAHYIREHGVKDYTSGQILELIKRLDVAPKSTRFRFLSREWALGPHRIEILD